MVSEAKVRVSPYELLLGLEEEGLQGPRSCSLGAAGRPQRCSEAERCAEGGSPQRAGG
jgi:hypothetical protein